MHSGFHRCRHEQSPDQCIGLQVEYWCLLCEIQLFPQVLEDFLEVPMIGDLHVVEFQPCRYDLTATTSKEFPGAP